MKKPQRNEEEEEEEEGKGKEERIIEFGYNRWRREGIFLLCSIANPAAPAAFCIFPSQPLVANSLFLLPSFSIIANTASY